MGVANIVAILENFRVVVFRAVAEHLSFRKAAEELYLTQPAVSFGNYILDCLRLLFYI